MPGSPDKSRSHIPPHRSLSKPNRSALAQRSASSKKQSSTNSAARILWRTVGSMVLISSVAGMLALVGAGLYTGYQLVMNPSADTLLDKVWPNWRQVNQAEPQSQLWSEIEAGIKTADLEVGEPISLHEDGFDPTQPRPFLLPLLDRRNGCETNCTRIAELRVYRPTQPSSWPPQPDQSFVQVDQLYVSGLSENFVLRPRQEALGLPEGSDRILSLTELVALQDNAPDTGRWFTLQGKYTLSGDPVLYGQVLQYDPDQRRLNFQLSWTSPADQLPTWRELSGAAPPELVVNQTVALEPTFRGYQLVDVPTVKRLDQLEEISFTNQILNDKTYHDALRLAQKGLWSAALQTLRPIKDAAKNWPEATEAQYQLIELHAQETRAQANSQWSSPSQQLLAYLVDGRWDDGLALFEEQSDSARKEMLSLLKADSGKLWGRVQTALQISPNQLDIRTWGGLLLAIQDEPDAAYTWLKQQSNPSAATEARVRHLLSLIDETDGTVLANASNAATTEAKNAASTLNLPTTSRIVGTASAIAPGAIQPNQWLWPSQPLSSTPPAGQTWYVIDVTQFHDGQRWQLPASTTLPKQATSLWQALGLHQDSYMRLTSWDSMLDSSGVNAQVQATKQQGNRLQLLALGAEISPTSTALAATATAFNWQPIPAPDSFGALYQESPQLAQDVWTVLWPHLQQTQYVLSLPVQDVAATLQQMQSWPIRRFDLTGDGQDELVLSLTSPDLHQLTAVSDRAAQLETVASRTLIFSANGLLLYSDLDQPGQTLTAIAQLSDSSGSTLVIRQANTFQLKTWSAQGQRFD